MDLFKKMNYNYRRTMPFNAYIKHLNTNTNEILLCIKQHLNTLRTIADMYTFKHNFSVFLTAYAIIGSRTFKSIIVALTSFVFIIYSHRFCVEMSQSLSTISRNIFLSEMYSIMFKK